MTLKKNKYQASNCKENSKLEEKEYKDLDQVESYPINRPSSIGSIGYGGYTNERTIPFRSHATMQQKSKDKLVIDVFSGKCYWESNE